MKYNHVHIWEWAAWLVAALALVYATVTTFEMDNLGASILLIIVLALLVCGFIYRLDHPEKYEQVVGWFTGSMTGKMVSGIAAARTGKSFSLSLERDRLMISDGHRETFCLSLTDVIDAEALNGKETQVRKAKQPAPEETHRARTNPSFSDKIKEQWAKWFDRYLIINYRDRNSGANQALVFLYRGDLKGKQFATELNHRAAFGETVNL